MEEVDDFAGEALEFVVEVVGEEVDPLMRAFDAAANFGEVRGLFVAELVEFGAELLEEFFQLLFQGGLSLEMVDDFKEDEEDGADGGSIDEPGGDAGRRRRREVLGEDGG